MKLCLDVRSSEVLVSERLDMRESNIFERPADRPTCCN